MSDKQRTHAARSIIESNPLAEAVALALEKRSKQISCRVRQTSYELAMERWSKSKKGLSMSCLIDELLLAYGREEIDLPENFKIDSEKSTK